jgi:hypothetical protein
MGGYFSSTRIFLVAFCLVGTLGALSGCGSDDSEATAVTVQTGSLSKAAFVKRANKICTDGQRQGFIRLKVYVDDEKLRDLAKMSAGQAEDILTTIVAPTYRKEIAEISELGVPKRDAGTITKMLEEISLGLEESQANPYQALKNGSTVGNAPDLARQYGLTACSTSWG